MLAQLSIFPIGKNAHLSRYVAAALDEIDRSGLDYRLTAMGTAIEGDWDEVMKLIRKVRDRVLKLCDRIYLTVSIDERKGGGRHMDAKVVSVERVLGKQLRH